MSLGAAYHLNVRGPNVGDIFCTIEEAAQLIIRLAQAVRLLGSEMTLVGVSSEIARTIVEIGVDLKGLKTLGTLQAGLAQALAARRLKIVPL